MHLTRYGELLVSPRVRRLVATALLGRLPNAMAELTIVLVVRAHGATYALAGAAAAAYGIGATVSAPLQGRLIDARGVRGVVAIGGVVSAAGFAGFWAACPSRSSLLICGACALAGGANPPLGAAMRGLWPRLVERADVLEAAYAFESTAQELIWIAGPLLIAVLLTVGPADLLVAGSIGMLLAGTVAFTAAAPPAPVRVAHERGRRGGAPRRGLVLLLAVRVIWMVGFGALMLGIPAFASRHGQPGATGIVIAVWSAASMIGGIAYGSRRWAGGLPARFTVLAAALALTSLPLTAAGSIAALAGGFVLFGVCLAPWLAAGDTLLQAVVSPGARTQAFTWNLALAYTGQAIGEALAGPAIGHGGPGAAFAGGSICFVAAAAVAALGARALRPPASAPSGLLAVEVAP